MDLSVAAEVIGASKPETLPRLSSALAGTLPHSGLAELITCAQSPFKAHGESPGGAGTAVTIAEVAALRPLVPAGGIWQGRATMAGVDVPVVALSSARTEPAALLVLLRAEDTPVPPERLAPALALWDLLTAHRVTVHTDVIPPGRLATSRAAAAARAIAISELGESHATALTTLLRTLRDRDLADADVRTRATDLTVTALSELRARVELDQALVEERAADAFDRLTDSLRRMLRPRGVRLDLGIPGAEEGADRMLPGDVVHAVSAVVRAVVYVSLEDQGAVAGRQVGRIHVGWKVGDTHLRATVRDDGPGALSRRSFDARRVVERLAPLGGRLDVDAVPDWGTTVTVEVPLASSDTPLQDPLTDLGARELEVLEQLARGRRNRDIAHQLHISESTVKFHLAKIFDKLGVTSRGEAAALAHQWGAV
ncbi:LuxR C-terminal-related transcriptional regulator [Streptomyces sp. NPDC004539]|uniref:helix-turn-helix transcriptional regulator n=1 Tax=Streptomyces sp. NPDC004539 TaxID=3154280 RepID=UPI0033B43AD9